MNVDGVVVGIAAVLPVDVLSSEFFQILAGFVAFNTLLYVTLAIGKILPRIPVGDWWFNYRGNVRSEDRSIYPSSS